MHICYGAKTFRYMSGFVHGAINRLDLALSSFSFLSLFAFPTTIVKNLLCHLSLITLNYLVFSYSRNNRGIVCVQQLFTNLVIVVQVSMDVNVSNYRRMLNDISTTEGIAPKSGPPPNSSFILN